jgi:hypothetical protein
MIRVQLIRESHTRMSELLNFLLSHSVPSQTGFKLELMHVLARRHLVTPVVSLRAHYNLMLDCFREIKPRLGPIQHIICESL